MSRLGILREPLLMFAVLGGMIYLAHAGLADKHEYRVVVSEDAIKALVSERELVLDRPLSPAERQALLDAHVDREILVREAIGRGLYRQDAQVHKRLADKMYFLLEDDPPEPTADQLQSQLDENRQDYLSPRAVTFEHVFFQTDRVRAEQAMTAVRAGSAVPNQVGDRFWLGQRLEYYSSKQLLVLLGFEFEQAVRALSPGKWHGPIRSARGWHLVRVEQHHEPRLLPEAELQQRLASDWKESWRAQQREKQLAWLRQRYNIVYPGSEG